MGSRLKVLIVGASLPGLTLAVLLELAGIDYLLLDRQHGRLKELGQSIMLSNLVLPLLEQIGIFEEIQAQASTIDQVELMDENQQILGQVDMQRVKERYGYKTLAMSRSRLQHILLSRIPSYKVLFSKRVLSVETFPGYALVKCSDNSSFQASIVVGADGPSSSIRQSLYRELKLKDMLPTSDNGPMPVENVSLVGLTKSLSPEKYPEQFGEQGQGKCHFRVMSSKDRPYTWATLCLPPNTIAWMVGRHLSSPELEDMDNGFRTSGWSPESAALMAKEVRDFACPYGGKLGDLIDATPKEAMARLLMEEGCFNTWYGGRSVLIGDSSRKLRPSIGFGASQNMLDAVILANKLYEIPSTSLEDITKVFSEFYTECSGPGRAAIKGSRQYTRFYEHQGLLGGVIRKLMLSVPSWLLNRMDDKTMAHRPQAVFLPFVVTKGKVKPKPQRQSTLLVNLQHNPAVEHHQQSYNHLVDANSPTPRSSESSSSVVSVSYSSGSLGSANL